MAVVKKLSSRLFVALTILLACLLLSTGSEAGIEPPLGTQILSVPQITADLVATFVPGSGNFGTLSVHINGQCLGQPYPLAFQTLIDNSRFAPEVLQQQPYFDVKLLGSLPPGCFANPSDILGFVISEMVELKTATPTVIEARVIILGVIPAAEGDIDGDLDVDRDDLFFIIRERNTSVDESICKTPCDLNIDGKITVKDGRILMRKCTHPYRCD